MAEQLCGYVVPLSAVGRGDAPIAGGKGANLGELIRAGAPVPAGFVLTCAAYDAHLHHCGLSGHLAELLAAAPDGSRAREAIRAADVPESVVEHLREAYTRLVGDPTLGAVAVRSSASAEDLPTGAMAGQHDTLLNVVGVPALIEAVRECWASLWTERAIDYRQRRGISNEGMAVVVQRMVPAEAAGTMFTADPVTGARDVIVVDATAGLGDSLVSGMITPDHLVLDKRSGRVRSVRTGTREVLLPTRPGGGVDQVEDAAASGDSGVGGTADADAPGAAATASLLGPPTAGASAWAAGTGVGVVLGEPELRRLARLGARVERHFGAPQDIEWAWYRGRPYLLQSRPITALPPPPPRRAYQRMFASLVAEVLPVRPYPLDVTTWLGALLAAVADVGRELGIGSHPLGELVVDDGVVVGMRPPGLRPTWRALLLPLLARRWARHGRRADDEVWAAAAAPVRELGARDLTAATWPEVLDTLHAACRLPPEVVELRLRNLPNAISALLLLGVLRLTRQTDLLGDLLSGTENRTAETDRALDALAATIRSDPGLAALFAHRPPAELPPLLAERYPAFLAEFHDFLDRYGHRETTSPLLATQPTWRDAPEVVLGLLRNRSARPGAPVPGPPAWQIARAKMLRHPLLRPPPARRLVDRWLAGARRAFRAREDSRFYLTLALPVVRGAMLELGRRLRDAGALDRPEDVFHLTLSELDRVSTWPPPSATVAELRERATRRAAARAALGDGPLINPAWYSDLNVRARVREALLHGVPGSPGVAAGPARIIHGAAEFHHLRPGEVLVTPYTNPAWTPLFPRAAAVVVDTGGPMSHAAIVAREYGIPAVMATGEATRRLADGQLVRVDGTHGVVEPA